MKIKLKHKKLQILLIIIINTFYYVLIKRISFDFLFFELKKIRFLF